VTIFVNKIYNLYVPNAFTPNGNGTNDTWEIFGNKKTWKFVHILIFNRWGEKMFESNDINFQWDGTYKGTLQEPNVYVYVLDVTFIDGYTDS
jgi:gliding motility-associated-like protein